MHKALEYAQGKMDLKILKLKTQKESLQPVHRSESIKFTGTAEAVDLKVRANAQCVGLCYHCDVEAVLSHSRSMPASSSHYTRSHMSQGSEPLAQHSTVSMLFLPRVGDHTLILHWVKCSQYYSFSFCIIPDYRNSPAIDKHRHRWPVLQTSSPKGKKCVFLQKYRQYLRGSDNLPSRLAITVNFFLVFRSLMLPGEVFDALFT